MNKKNSIDCFGSKQTENLFLDLDRTFELLPGKTSSNPGILIVDNLHKYFYNTKFSSKFGQKLFYMCSFKKKTKCKATAVLLRDDAGNVEMDKCDSEDVHNHEASEGKVIASKMQKEMVDMIKTD